MLAILFLNLFSNLKIVFFPLFIFPSYSQMNLILKPWVQQSKKHTVLKVKELRFKSRLPPMNLSSKAVMLWTISRGFKEYIKHLTYWRCSTTISTLSYFPESKSLRFPMSTARQCLTNQWGAQVAGRRSVKYKQKLVKCSH